MHSPKKNTSDPHDIPLYAGFSFKETLIVQSLLLPGKGTYGKLHPPDQNRETQSSGYAWLRLTQIVIIYSLQEHNDTYLSLLLSMILCYY